MRNWDLDHLGLPCCPANSAGFVVFEVDVMEIHLCFPILVNVLVHTHAITYLFILSMLDILYENGDDGILILH